MTGFTVRAACDMGKSPVLLAAGATAVRAKVASLMQ